MDRKSKIISLVLLLVLGVIFSIFKLTESPPTWYDEGIYNQIAVNTGLYGTQGIQVAPNTFISSAFVTGGYPFLLPVAWSTKMFGIGILQVRLVMVLFILALLLVSFFYVYRIFGIKSALLSLLLLVSFPVLYGNGKNVLGEVPGLFYLLCFLISVYYLEKGNYKDLIYYITAGLAGGLCLSTKPIFFLLGGAVVVSVYIYRKSIIFNWKYLFIGFVAFMAPMVLWFSLQFVSTDSTSSILSYYANPYGLNDIVSVMFNNFKRFFTEPSAIYFLIIEVIWAISYFIRLRKKQNISLSEAIAFTFSVLVLFAYLRTAGWYRYFFVAEVVAIIFLPNSLRVISEYINKKYLITVMMICFVSIQSYQLIFDSWVADHYGSSISRDMRVAINSLPKDTTFFIYNVPEITIFLPNQNYYQYMEPTKKIIFGAEQMSVLQAGIPDILITTKKQWSKLEEVYGNYKVREEVSSYVILSNSI